MSSERPGICAILKLERVKRSQHFQDEDSSKDSQVSTKSTSPVVQNAVGQRAEAVGGAYGFVYDYITPNVQETKIDPDRADSPSCEVAAGGGEPEYNFQLFASGTISKGQDTALGPFATGTKIRLSATPEPVAVTKQLSLEDANFVRPNRPEAYYFTSALKDEEVQRLRFAYQQAAVSTSEVLARAKSSRWPGTALLWRLFEVESLSKVAKSERNGATRPNTSTSEHSKSLQMSTSARTKPSKKRRIHLRRRLALRNELAAQEKASEETEREKRTRRNREKKLKKKERDKKKKLEADGGGSHGVGVKDPANKGENHFKDKEGNAVAVAMPPTKEIIKVMPESFAKQNVTSLQPEDDAGLARSDVVVTELRPRSQQQRKSQWHHPLSELQHL